MNTPEELEEAEQARTQIMAAVDRYVDTFCVAEDDRNVWESAAMIQLASMAVRLLGGLTNKTVEEILSILLVRYDDWVEAREQEFKT